MIIIKDLKYPLRDFSLNVNLTTKASCIGIWGPNGAGKTSLFETLCGIKTPKKGLIQIKDHCLFNSKTQINLAIQKRKIAYIPQENSLFPHLSIEKNIRYGFKKSISAKKKMEEIVFHLSLESFLNQMPNEISDGEKQRVALARALLSEFNLLLLDEALNCINIKIKTKIFSFLKETQKKKKNIILYISQNPKDFKNFCQKILTLNQGIIESFQKTPTFLKTLFPYLV